MPSSYTLGDHFEGLVKRLTASGRYASASEVLRDGLRLLEEREQQRAVKLEALRQDIAAGLASGTSTVLDMNELIEEAQHSLRGQRKLGGQNTPLPAS